MTKIIGSIKLPGDKSISHRAALFSAIGKHKTTIKNFNFNEDCSSTLNILKQFGIKWSVEDEVLRIEGQDISNWQKPEQVLDAGNSGTTARLISAIFSSLPFETTLNGDASLQKRPMKRVINPLSEIGAKIKSNDGYLPLHFTPTKQRKGIKYKLPMASAQVKSAVLLAGLFADGTTEVIESVPTRDHTERMLGLKVVENGDNIRSIYSDNQTVIPDMSMTVPGDFSSAAFFIAATLALPGSDLTIENISLNPTRTGLMTLLNDMGANISEELVSVHPEPIGKLHVKHTSVKNVNIPKELIANIIDEIPILAILATQAEGRFELKNAEELRYKESDRIKMMVENLKTIGLEIEEYKDGFAFEAPQKLKGGKILTAGDHRIAMAFAIANLFSEGEIVLDNPQCVSVSFPTFWDLLNALT